ncbi:MAG: hypothetical protein CW338_01060 [Clostridiales bacterium]|nr:hypothetical protein [Clostridiales bacterium]
MLKMEMPELNAVKLMNEDVIATSDCDIDVCEDVCKSFSCDSDEFCTGYQCTEHCLAVSY